MRGSASERAKRIERQLATAQQITHIGSWEWDAQTNVVTWSDELYRIYGLEPRSMEITFESFLARVHPDDRAQTQREVAAALQRGSRFAYIERILRPDGSVRELDTVGECARDATGRIIGLIGTCRDVTEERARDRQIRLYASIVENVQIGLTVWSVGDVEDIAAVRLVAFNAAAARMAGEGLELRSHAALLDVFPTASATPLPQFLLRVAREGQAGELATFRATVADDVRTFAVKAFPLLHTCVGLAFEDTTEATRAREVQISERTVLEMATSGARLEDIMTTLAIAIEQQVEPAIASVLLLDSTGTRVRQCAAPHMPAEYNKWIDGQAIGPRAGTCGTALYRREPVHVEDTETDPLWKDYRELARTYALRACWSTPIVASDGRVLGTFALYYDHPHRASPRDRDIVARATHVAGIAIERVQVEEQLRELSAHVEAAREDERAAIAREIHDELGQSLTALKMDLRWIQRRATGTNGLPTDALVDKIEQMSQMTDDVIDQVRRICAELRPGVLDDLGLLAALEWQAQEFQRRTGILCMMHSNLGEARLERNLSTAVFRIFQEALTNVARHAEAHHVDASLERKDGRLRLEVQDDGRGITQELAHSGRSFGLLGVRERARRLGGMATVTGEQGKGTRVTIDVPLRKEDA